MLLSYIRSIQQALNTLFLVASLIELLLRVNLLWLGDLHIENLIRFFVHEKILRFVLLDLAHKEDYSLKMYAVAKML